MNKMFLLFLMIILINGCVAKNNYQNYPDVSISTEELDFLNNSDANSCVVSKNGKDCIVLKNQCLVSVISEEKKDKPLVELGFISLTMENPKGAKPDQSNNQFSQSYHIKKIDIGQKYKFYDDNKSTLILLESIPFKFALSIEGGKDVYVSNYKGSKLILLKSNFVENLNGNIIVYNDTKAKKSDDGSNANKINMKIVCTKGEVEQVLSSDEKYEKDLSLEKYLLQP
jgi:hypothetical protein